VHNSSALAHNASTSVCNPDTPTPDASTPAASSANSSTDETSTPVHNTPEILAYSQTDARAMDRVAAVKRNKLRRLAQNGIGSTSEAEDEAELAEFRAALEDAASSTIDIAQKNYKELTYLQQKARNATSVRAFAINILILLIMLEYG
jgi:hypothetical protein